MNKTESLSRNERLGIALHLSNAVRILETLGFDTYTVDDTTERSDNNFRRINVTQGNDTVRIYVRPEGCWATHNGERLPNGPTLEDHLRRIMNEAE